VLAVAPDLDFVPGILVDRPALHHQAASHSLAAALIVGLVTAIVLFRDRTRWLRGWLLFSSAYASHLLIDLFGADGRPPFGMPLFWPFSDATFLAPWTLLPGIAHADSSETGTRAWLASVLSWTNVRSILIELAVLGPPVALAVLRLRRRGRTSPSAATRSL
jgi:membrane-bound metal-dependent hydrolase YbcI (DUF457 family)